MKKKAPLDYIYIGFITGTITGFILFPVFYYLIKRLIELWS